MKKQEFFFYRNGQTLEVVHRIPAAGRSLGDFCEWADRDVGETDEGSPVREIITTATMAETLAGNSELKNLGFTKVENRYDCVC